MSNSKNTLTKKQKHPKLKTATPPPKKTQKNPKQKQQQKQNQKKIFFRKNKLRNQTKLKTILPYTHTHKKKTTKKKKNKPKNKPNKKPTNQTKANWRIKHKKKTVRKYPCL